MPGILQRRQLRVESVSLNAGATNTVEIFTTEQFPNVSVDDVLISTADDLATAQPHRQALSLSAGDRAALLAYVRQLDGRAEDGAEPFIFADGFESGDVSAW